MKTIMILQVHPAGLARLLQKILVNKISNYHHGTELLLYLKRGKKENFCIIQKSEVLHLSFRMFRDFNACKAAY
jgi:hypothetical protein